MEKLRMETADLTQKNIEKIRTLFPNVITEMRDENGKLKKGINFEILKQELSSDVIDGEECYDFTWVGKKAAIVEGNTPIRKTLRPCIEESKDWENTENLYIEGDNLEVLKLLQESYLNSVKMIYIDPPYNTGKDFIYKDKFNMDKEEYDEQIGMLDEDENRLFKNTDTNGRFHSEWCSMMYPRLKLAQNLLSEDGVIFISIDDNEIENLKKMCMEIFGENNFVENIIWEKKFSPQNDAKWFSHNHDHILVFAKNKDNYVINQLPRTEEHNQRYNNPDNDSRGAWASSDLSVKTYSAEYDYPIKTPSGKIIELPPGRCWMTNKTRMKELIADNRIWFGESGDNLPRLKRFLSEVKNGITPISIWYRKDVGDTQSAKRQLLGVMPENVFQTPKPVELIERMIYLSTDKNDIILDFFAGSSTTAHSVIQQNIEDDGDRKFIMVQLPEFCDEKSEAYKAGYRTVSDIGKERIRRAGEKIKEDNKDKENIESLDIGFRVLKVDDTNMKDVYYSADEYNQDMLGALESNIKEDRTDLDLLYGVLLDWGLPLSLKHDIEEVYGVTIHTVDEGSLIACFDEKVTEDVVREIAKRQPLRVVFRDSSFADSPDKINVEEIFKLLAPNTTVKVI